MNGIMVYTTSETLNKKGKHTKQMPDNYFFKLLTATVEHPMGWLSFLGIKSLIKCDDKHGN